MAHMPEGSETVRFPNEHSKYIGRYRPTFIGIRLSAICPALDIMSKLLILATAALFVGSASAHTIFQKLYVNGVDQGELTGIRAPDYDGVRSFLPLRFSSGPVAHHNLIHSP